jgi:hypothetical protein
MKKIITLFAIGILLSACKQTPTAQNVTTAPAQEMTDAGSLIAAGKSVKCETTKADEGLSMTSYMMGAKVKTTGITTSDKTYQGAMISDGQSMYTWDETKKTGIKATLPNPEDIKAFAEKQGQSIPDIKDDAGRENWKNLGYTINCTEAVLSDSDFVPPTDVQFTDVSGMMDSVNKMMKQSETDEPVEQFDQKTMEQKANELMKQYQAQ